MKKYLLMMSFTLIASLFLFTSCEKEEMDEDEYGDTMNPDTMQAVVTGFRGNDTLISNYPAAIDEFLAINYPNLEVIDVTLDGSDFEVELADGTTLLFDSEGGFISETLPEEEESDDDTEVTEWPMTIDDYVLLNYPNDTIDEVNLEDEEYTVELTSDIELLFDIDGNFLEELPEEELMEWPTAIDDYVLLNYPDTVIEEVELEDEYYEVELEDGTELLFDLDGNFLEEELPDTETDTTPPQDSTGLGG